MNITDSVSTVLTGASTSDTPSDAEIAAADSRFADMLADEKTAKDELREITSGGATGYWAWKIKQMREHIADQVMGEMNTSKEKIAAMDAKERVATENRIMKEVEERLKLAIREEMKREQKNTLAANATLQSVIDIGQGIPLN